MGKIVFSIVVRYSGERTYDQLQRKIAEWLPNVPTECVSSESFEKTLRMSFEKALELASPWSVILDADILLSKRFFSFYLPRAISRARDGDLGFAFQLLDRFYQAPKFRGLHVYRTEMLNRAMSKIPKEGSTLRPETFVKEQLAAEGASWIKYGNVVGLHDFYQHPSDIFSKMALRAHRSRKDVGDLLRAFEDKKDEIDFVVASEGLKYGLDMDPKLVDNARTTYSGGFQEMMATGRIDDLAIEREQKSAPSVDRYVFAYLRSSSLKRAVRNYLWLYRI